MKFLHMADVHLGCVPDGRMEWAAERKRELWETFRDTIADADRMKADLVLIAGDSQRDVLVPDAGEHLHWIWCIRVNEHAGEGGDRGC